MKANEAPEKIWMDLEWISHFDCKDCITEDSIEYVRKDVFIEKASKWIIDNFPTVSGISALMYADDFKKAMKL